MPDLFDFSEQYKNMADDELLRILDNASSYVPDAIAAAKQELISRNLSSARIAELKKNIKEEKRIKEKRKERASEIRKDITEKSTNLLTWFSLSEDKISQSERIRKGILIASFLLFCYLLYSTWSDIRFLFNSLTEISISYSITLIPIIILPAGIFLFWKRMSAGWKLLTFFYIFNFLSTIWLAAWSFSYSSGSSSFAFFPRSGSSQYIFPFILYGCFLLALLRKDIRNDYKISSDAMWVMVLVAGIWTVAVLFMLNVK
ncbi:MAG TPA: hypothetical protein PKC69_13840 [Chitinophagaceae bacterium]|nr:hypothetical protein [Chitinophagaceae bacterium]